jgi:hypothetical protein
MNNKDIRWRPRFQNFRRAYLQLAGAASLEQQRPLSELEQ